MGKHTGKAFESLPPQLCTLNYKHQNIKTMFQRCKFDMEYVFNRLEPVLLHCYYNSATYLVHDSCIKLSQAGCNFHQLYVDHCPSVLQDFVTSDCSIVVSPPSVRLRKQTAILKIAGSPTLLPIWCLPRSQGRCWDTVLWAWGSGWHSSCLGKRVCVCMCL